MPRDYYSMRNTFLEIDLAATYIQAIDRGSRSHYILIILDIQFTEMNRVADARRLRQLEQFPLLVLSARYSRQEEIKALNAGADIYLPAVLSTKETALIQVAGFSLKINLETRKAFLNGENLHLPPKQFGVLQLLVDRIGKIVTKEEPFKNAWKAECNICADDALKYHIREICRKLGQHGMAHLIETAWGVGYQLSLEENSSGW